MGALAINLGKLKITPVDYENIRIAYGILEERLLQETIRASTK